MNHWLIWAALFLAVALFIWRLNIFADVVYLKKPDNHFLKISVLLFKRLKLYTFQISPPDFLPDKTSGAAGPKPQGEKTGGAPAEKERQKPSGGGNFNLGRQLLGKLAATLYFEKIRLALTYGFEDAALTGVSNGVLAALRGVFLAACGTYLKMKEQPDISFSPVYGRNRLEVEFNCIFSIRLGDVIAIAAGALAIFCVNTIKRINFIQGGETRWRNILFRT